MTAHPLAIAVFAISLALTFSVAVYARLKSQPNSSDEDLAGRGLSKWLVGLSAATTGNSGFIVTAAVGLGYSGGAQWLLLPLGWLIGDLLYWSLFPDKINKLARDAGATTIAELLTYDLRGRAVRPLVVVTALILAVFLSIYTASQWLAGRVFLGTAFALSDLTALFVFGATIVAYSSIGGFRGSVYVDVLQAVIRIGGTVLALVLIGLSAYGMGQAFSANIAAAGPGFLDPFAGRGIAAGAAFVLGYAGASIGFGLGQPQIVSRYMAGQSPEETKSARWIYIIFLQSTWIAMTVFGIVLRGVTPGIADPEAGLSLYFLNNAGAIATGIIFADVYATVAGTSNGLLVAISTILRRDLLGPRLGERTFSLGVTTAFTLVLGLTTVVLSLTLPGSVYSLALGAVSMIGAALAGAVMIKILSIRHDATSLLGAVAAGFSTAGAWHVWGPAGAFNETAIGMFAALAVNYVLARLRPAERVNARKGT